MHVILPTIGTSGDVFPYAGLGVSLKARGHRATLVTAENYRGVAEQNGLEFVPLVSAAEHDELFQHRDFWHPFKTVRLSAKWAMRLIERQHHVLLEVGREPETVFVTSPAIFAASVAAEKTGRPVANLILQPWMIPSSVSPPVMPFFKFPRWTPKSLVQLFWRALDATGDRLVGPDLNRLRAAQGLKPIRRIFSNWLSPQLIIAMFPEWYGPPASDWPAQVRLSGFPMFDGALFQIFPPTLREFLKSGEPPVAITFGTGMMHAGEVYKQAVEACRLLKIRAIVLTSHVENLAPCEQVHHCSFAPFRELFPSCAAVIHHGGVGTTAKALAAGIPQLILPYAFDQMDNATRVARLGAGEWLKPRKQHVKSIVAALRRILSPTVQKKCEGLAAKFGDDDGLENAAGFVEELYSRTANRMPA
jgi:UDP:flavonoid glycosyltransferase YjiC (YdhE family)